MNKFDEREVNPIEEMIRIAESFLKLTSWWFQESYRSSVSKIIIYNSEWCRIKLIWGGWDSMGGNNMHIRYGRLHAPNEATTIDWNGEECHCWHNFDYALHFLDGLTSTEAAALSDSHPLIDQFYEAELRQKFKRRQPEWLALMHTTIWENYNIRFFELFDLRKPDLWQQYRNFLKEVYDIEGRIPEITPSLDKVC